MAIKHQTDTALAQQASKVVPPAMWRVVLLNDDFTPMDFVVAILQGFFGFDSERATQIMLQIHRESGGVGSVFRKVVAATKISEVTRFARQHQHPLQCIMEIEQ